MDTLIKSSIISKGMQVEGWFEEVELCLLIDCVERVAIQSKSNKTPLNIVEIGSYKGRSTIVMGLAMVALHLNEVLYAVDPHEGIRSGKYDRIHHNAETYEDFLQNVKTYGLEDIIKCIKSKSTETTFDFPISMILIDGLHFFENLKEDFLHFENNLIKGSLIAFHDYTEEFPGVFRFVNFILNTKQSSYVKINQALSLIIFEKVN